MLKDHQTTMLITHGKDGGLVSRPMTAQKPEFDGDLWFFVSSDADVLEEVDANPEVNVSYSLKDNFLSLAGTAAVVDDDAKKKELWYPELKQWFDGAEPEDAVVKLIKVAVKSARYWDMSGAGSKKQGNPIESEIIKY
jgi:general stress protein 26